MRTFLALALPTTVREGLGRLGRRLGHEADGWRWVRPEGLHLTVRFLGEVLDPRDPGSREAWAAAAAGVGRIRMRLGTLGCFRHGRAPRLLWISVHECGGQRLERLARAVESAAVGLGFAPSRRPFRPHLTLARTHRGGNPSMPAYTEAGIDAVFEVDALTLFSSELLPAGARYTVLERFPLGRHDA